MSNKIRQHPATMGAPWSRECVKTKHRSGRYGGRHVRRELRRRTIATRIGEYVDWLDLDSFSADLSGRLYPDPSYLTGRGA